MLSFSHVGEAVTPFRGALSWHRNLLVWGKGNVGKLKLLTLFNAFLLRFFAPVVCHRQRNFSAGLLDSYKGTLTLVENQCSVGG